MTSKTGFKSKMSKCSS